MRYFISQPMKGRTPKEIQSERNSISSVIRQIDEEAEILDSYFGGLEEEVKNAPLKFLAKSLEILADADVAVFADGYHKARGCRIEHMCAFEYGIYTIDAADLSNK